jgi:hypothetical protein
VPIEALLGIIFKQAFNPTVNIRLGFAYDRNVFTPITIMTCVVKLFLLDLVIFVIS